MKLIVRVDQRAPVALFSIWYKVGGSYEPNGTTGVSHLLEHMMFKGTKKYDSGFFNRKIAELGGSQNAMTGEDYTMYFQALPTDKLPTSLELESDRMKNLLLRSNEFAMEKKVVMEERRMRVDDNPQGLLWERFKAATFVNSPYHNPVVGWMTDLKHMTLKDLQNWYTTWYAPNNAIIVVVGKVDPDHIFALTQKYFGSIKPVHLKQLKPRNEVAQIGQRCVTVNVPAKRPVLFLGYNAPSLATAKSSEQTKQIYALRVAAYFLGSGQSSRLAKDLVRDKNIAITTYATYNIFRLHQSVFYIGAIPQEGVSIDQLKSSILSEVSRLKKQKLSKQDLELVKAKLVAERIYDKDSLMNQAIDLGVPEMIGLSWRDSESYMQNIKKVTADEVQTAVKKYLSNNSLTVGILKPTKMTGKKVK